MSEEEAPLRSANVVPNTKAPEFPVADPTPFHGAYVIGRDIAEPDPVALDDSLGEQLWAESARLVGLQPSAAASA